MASQSRTLQPNMKTCYRFVTPLVTGNRVVTVTCYPLPIGGGNSNNTPAETDCYHEIL
jgi:hypothetical protein